MNIGHYNKYSDIIQPQIINEVFMPIIQPLAEEINGFKIVKDLGIAINNIRYALVICKECNQEFQTSVYHMNVIKSCGCLPCNPPKKLPEEINGFKILKDLGYSKGSRRCIAICKECKKEYQVDPNKLKYRKHCGCLKKGSIVSRYSKSHPRLGNTYKHMVNRCYKSKDKDYYLYGAKGITICDEWLKDRNIFCEWALKNGYTDDLTIDRIDSSKGYYPENCRWVNNAVQARNTNRNVMTMELAEIIRIEINYMRQIDLAKKYNVSIGTIWNIVNNRSWK